MAQGKMSISLSVATVLMCAALLLAACSSIAAMPISNRKLLQQDVTVTTSAARITPGGTVTTTGDAGAWGSGAAGSRVTTIDKAFTDPHTGEVTTLTTQTVGTSYSTPGAGSYATVANAQQTDSLYLASSGTVMSQDGGSAQLDASGTASNGEAREWKVSIETVPL